MIKQFRNLSPVNLFFLVVVTIVLRMGTLFQIPALLEFNFAEVFNRLLMPVPVDSPFAPAVNIFIATFLIIIQAVWLNRIINEHNLLGKPTFLPALMYVTASGILTPFTVLSPALLCNFLLIWMIGKFLNIHRRTEVTSVMYDLGFIVGIGTLIYFPFIAMFVLLYVTLLIFRAFSWREWLSGFLGFATVYFFLAVFYFWNDSLSKFYTIWLPLANPFPSKIRINFYNYIVLIPLLAILGLSGLSIRQNFFRSYVQVRKAFQLLFGLMVLALVSFYLEPQVRIYHFLLAVPPVAVFMAYYFLHAKKRWIFESLFFLLLVFVVYFQFV